jgi:hypothetical protein
MLKLYIFNVLIALDQFANALIGGDPDETISSRCAKRRDQPGWRILAAFLEWLQPGHLDRSLEVDEGSRTIF